VAMLERRVVMVEELRRQAREAAAAVLGNGTIPGRKSA